MTSNPVKEEAVTLLPCPLCGDAMTKGLRSFGWFGHRDKDAKCPIAREDFPPADHAAWNTRQADPRIAELKAALEHIANYYGEGHRITELARAALNRKENGRLTLSDERYTEGFGNNPADRRM